MNFVNYSYTFQPKTKSVSSPGILTEQAEVEAPAVQKPGICTRLKKTRDWLRCFTARKIGCPLHSCCPDS